MKKTKEKHFYVEDDITARNDLEKLKKKEKMKTINILTRADVEEITKKIVERKLSYMEDAFDKLRLRVIEMDNILCNFIERNRK